MIVDAVPQAAASNLDWTANRRSRSKPAHAPPTGDLAGLLTAGARSHALIIPTGW